MIYLVIYLVRPPRQDIPQRGLGLGGLVHEKAHYWVIVTYIPLHVHNTLNHNTETRPRRSTLKIEKRPRCSIFQTLNTETRSRRWTLKTTGYRDVPQTLWRPQCRIVPSSVHVLSLCVFMCNFCFQFCYFSVLHIRLLCANNNVLLTSLLF